MLQVKSAAQPCDVNDAASRALSLVFTIAAISNWRSGFQPDSANNLPGCLFAKPARQQARRSSFMCMIAAIAVLLPLVAMAFTPPNEKTIRDAIGDLSGLPVVLQRAFAPDRDSFDSIPKPEPNDWLAVHQEPGQTFDEFKVS